MRVLIIDDGPNKKYKWVQEIIVELGFDYDVAVCINQALRNIYKNPKRYQALILDMQLPRYMSGVEMVGKGGEEILKRTERKNIIIPTVINSTMPLRDEYFAKYKSFYGILPIYNKAFLAKFLEDSQKGIF